MSEKNNSSINIVPVDRRHETV